MWKTLGTWAVKFAVWAVDNRETVIKIVQTVKTAKKSA